MSGATSPTAAWVDASGIHAPSYADVLAYLNGQFQAIYGSDIVITPDSQDGQMLGIFALAIADANAACVAVYNSFSPSTAQGVGLSSMVKLNGMLRAVPTASTVELTLVGQAYTVILNGIAQDDSGQQWLLPASVEIPFSGAVSVTATAAALGAVNALPNTITTIATVTLGWQSVTNPAAAVLGAPLESDAALRARQATSTAAPSETVLAGIVGAVLALPGVTACAPYENDTNATDANGLPPHSISLVVEGGDSQQICDTILLHKTPGCYTYGSTRHTSVDVYNLPHDIGFFIPVTVPIGVHVTLKAGTGYSSIIGAGISQAVSDYINSLASGDDVVWSKLWLPANLCDVTTGLPSNATGTYDIQDIMQGTPPSDVSFAGYSHANIPISIFQLAACTPADVIVTAAP